MNDSIETVVQYEARTLLAIKLMQVNLDLESIKMYAEMKLLNLDTAEALRAIVRKSDSGMADIAITLAEWGRTDGKDGRKVEAERARVAGILERDGKLDKEDFC